jgi:SNF family Na+-dependent transporter
VYRLKQTVNDMIIFNNHFIKQIDRVFNYSALNQTLMKHSKKLQSQFALGVFYMGFSAINTTLIERGIDSGVGRLSELLHVDPYFIVGFGYLMSVYCFLRDRLPLHYALGTIPIGLYGVFVAVETLNGQIQLTGLLAALYLLTLPYLAVVGIVNRYLLKSANRELNDIKQTLANMTDNG